MIKDLSEGEKKTLMAWFIVAVIFLLILIVIKIINPDFSFQREKKIDYSKNKYSVVTDYNRYYTVTNAINKYYSFINAHEYESVYHILDEEYTKEKNVDKDTVINIISDADKALSYRGGLMCSKDIAKGITSYIVKGDEIFMNSSGVNKTIYYEIILDGNKFHYSIKPIEEEFFGGNCNG